jgi:glycine cleavage system H protein
MKNQSTNSVIPDGELRCVWMDAGVTEFKLCDKEFCCDTCTFNTNFVQQHKDTTTSPFQDDLKSMTDGRTMTADSYFNTVLKKRLDTLRNVPIPQDRIYNRGQFWIQQNAAGNYHVGINHILANFFQPILSIVMSKAPANIHRHDPFCWIILPGGAITLRSPIDATITRFNPALQQVPNLLNTAPFTGGWIMEITAKSKGLNSFASSTDAHRLAKQMLHTIEHIFKQTFQRLQPTVGATLYDGGIGLATIESILGPTVYREVVNRITHFPP